MEIEKKENIIYIQGKELNSLDKLVLSFIKLIKFDYVIVSGYVAILFGRSRTTEDIDLFVEPKSENEFSKFCDSIKNNGFHLLNAENAKDAYNLIKEGSSLRIIFGDDIFPNFEIKFPNSNLAKLSLRDKIKVIIGNKYIFISPLELQIAYKLYLGSDKDFEDARHLYKVLKDKLEIDRFKYFLKDMNISANVIKNELGEEIEI